MKITKIPVLILAFILVVVLPRVIYSYQHFALRWRESAPREALRNIQELQKSFHAKHGKYSYDLKTLGFPATNEVTVGFSRICAQKIDPESRIIRSYQLLNQPQLWWGYSGGKCSNTVVVQEDKNAEKFIEEIFEDNVKCSEVQKGYEATATISSCENYGVYRITEEGKFEIIRSIVRPFSYIQFIKSFF